MACQNCYNGCAEIISDRCVRYTGIDIPSLGISTGDPLSEIERALSEFLISALNGTGIHPVIDPDIICDLINSYLPSCGELTIVDFVNALIKSTCDLQEQVDINTSSIATLNADYTIGCLTGVVTSSDTHIIVQAIITKLCSVDATLTALSSTLATNYSSNGVQLDAYIANYLTTHSGGSTLISNKMVPFVAYPYFGSLANFDANGVGIPSGDWVNIYLCNGYLGKTPDMRGRVPVAATAGPGPAIIDPFVLPGGFNPDYIVGGALHGQNSILLTAATVPNHTHSATATATQDSHFHYEFSNTDATGTNSRVSTLTYPNVVKQWGATTPYSYEIEGSLTAPTLGKTSSIPPAITVNSITINPTTLGGNAHSNIQPSIACYYIMFVP